ncbi:hypothetical protein ACLOJK_034226 [Asimina triloba]
MRNCLECALESGLDTRSMPDAYPVGSRFLGLSIAGRCVCLHLQDRTWRWFAPCCPLLQAVAVGMVLTQLELGFICKPNLQKTGAGRRSLLLDAAGVCHRSRWVELPDGAMVLDLNAAWLINWDLADEDHWPELLKRVNLPTSTSGKCHRCRPIAGEWAIDLGLDIN